MLQTLLNELRKGGTLPVETLAARLNVSPQLVQAMLEDLQRRGMLQQLDASCGDGCGGCSLAGACGAGGAKGKVWMLKTH